MFSKTNQNRIIHCVLTLLLALMAFTAQGQRNTTVTGVVTDTQGPVPGVSIIVKGTLNGTTSDIDGKFSLNVKDKDILQVSCIGYLSQEINWSGQASLEIALEADLQKLEDVVVVGFATQRKVDLTGAVSQVKMEDVLGDRPLVSASAALQGAMPGLMVSGSSSPGQAKSFNIRGTLSINGGSPLVLIDNVEGAPQVNYKEAITATVQHREVFKKQTGGRGKFADIIVEIGPADEGVTGLQFDNQVKGGNIPKEFIPCIEKGFKAAMANGVLAGYEVQSLKVTVLDGSYHPVDSDQLSFEMAGRLAFRHACPKAKPVLLEPIMSLEVVTPEDYMGDIVGDLNRRRGQIQAMDSTANGARIVRAFVPLAEQFGYVTVLRTLSSGRATSTMTFDHYAEVPANLAKDVIEKSGYKLSDDDE